MGIGVKYTKGWMSASEALMQQSVGFISAIPGSIFTRYAFPCVTTGFNPDFGDYFNKVEITKQGCRGCRRRKVS